MWKPSPDPVYVRASVWPRCDLACRYCPIDEGMENRTPLRLARKEHRLSTSAYLVNMEAIAAAGVEGVSFTGGEPTLRPDLDRLIAGCRPLFRRVELTTNGARLHRFAAAIKANIDLMKVSLDAVEPAEVTRITGRAHGFRQALAAIDWAVRSSVPLGINTVLLRQTAPSLDRTIEFVRKITSGASAPVYLSLLDFYFTPSRRVEWESDFIPVNDVLDRLSARYGAPVEQERFGCRFWWFEVDGLKVRVKDSWSATMRAPKCDRCVSYCQEGIYGVKHSAEGWFTTCPSDREELGVHLSEGLTSEERSQRVRSVLADVAQARVARNSFDRMVKVHTLRPVAVVGQSVTTVP